MVRSTLLEFSWSSLVGVGVPISIRTFQRVCILKCFGAQILYPNIGIEPKPWNSRPMNLFERPSYLFRFVQKWRNSMDARPILTHNDVKQWQKFKSHEIRMFENSFVDIFGVSCGAFWTKIGGNQAETIPNLPIYPRALDSYKKTQKIAKEKLRKKRKSRKKTSRLLAVERINF